MNKTKETIGTLCMFVFSFLVVYLLVDMVSEVIK